MPNLKETTDIIGILKKMTSKELAVTIIVAILSVTAAFWVENRYANLVQTQNEIQKQQTQVLHLQNQILTVVNSLPEEVRKEIIERAKASKALDSLTQNNCLNC